MGNVFPIVTDAHPDMLAAKTTIRDSRTRCEQTRRILTLVQESFRTSREQIEQSRRLLDDEADGTLTATLPD